MWAATMPYYSEYHTSRRPGIDNKTQPSSKASSILDDGSSGHESIAEMLEPAIDGPPSPERLRQLSQQAKRASHLRRIPGHRTASSGSSSMRTGNNADRAAWELTLENMSLGRKSSARSSSSTASRERDSVQFLGRGLFHRKNKANRESKSSSGSSLYSADTSTNDSFVAGAKETLSVPSLFSRRKPPRDDASPTSAQRRLQISGPFNFEHVASTRREHMIDNSNLSHPGPTSAPAMSIEMIHPLSGFPSPETPRTHQFGPMTAPLQQRPPLMGRHTAPAPGPRRLVKHVRSQDHLRASPPRAPPRPPRSPRDPISPPPMPPVPPPRVSSQAFDAYPTLLERPQTSGGFRRPQPFGSSALVEDILPPPATSYGYMPPADFDAFGVNHNRFSHAITTPDEDAWPLSSPESSTPTYEMPLADVPEEEESHTRPSRLSMASNKSSLRGSQSVPMLRSLAQSQRPMSGASDTLGLVDAPGGHAMISSRQSAGQSEIMGPNDNWEDCIDYCYEHEADANFDYQWDRTSMEADRDALEMTPADEDLAKARSTSTSLDMKPGVGGHTAQFLYESPETRFPPLLHNEGTFGPGSTANNNNFSLPRNDRASHLSSLKLRPMSCASSFKESHGFDLSPSLLIPGDYHQEMLLSASDHGLGFAHDVSALPYRNPDESRFDPSATFKQRCSTSTTASNYTAHSDATSGRHNSANSSWTASTRLTASTTSLTKLASSVAELEEPRPDTHNVDTSETIEQNLDGADTDIDAVPDLIPFPTTFTGRKSYHKSHASESTPREETSAAKHAEVQKTRRGRARTTSLSTPAPPVGQYALFPRAYVKQGSGDRI
ncbi:hypothetical protein NLU13_7320 [Sarocladium strictum]|uniref:Uncharacterized protein n=1 Tax=Sarocladium strictum TaxID=5046 RepID=A0AA39L5G4_SARSR|nr:hypothetical protein NLU13_7320 [Sarocladium strictum]